MNKIFPADRVVFKKISRQYLQRIRVNKSSSKEDLLTLIRGFIRPIFLNKIYRQRLGNRENIFTLLAYWKCDGFTLIRFH